jgi:SAM-dependent methyltransferase
MIEITGERYIPGISSKRLAEEHILRYEFAKFYCKDKCVLDIACGTGYGSYEIKKVAKFVVGVDISTEAINYAMSHYKAKNIEYILDDATTLRKVKNKFDVIVSFETIEHLDSNNRKLFLKNISRLLKSDGLLILSTPNKKVTSPFSSKPLNKFHYTEFTRESLLNELSPFFRVEKIYGQRFVFSLFLTRPIWLLYILITKILNFDFGLYTTLPTPKVLEWNSFLKQPRIMIVLARKKLER